MFENILTDAYYGNTLLEWTIALGIIIGSYVGGKIVYYLFGKIMGHFTSKTKTQLDDILIDMIEEPLMFGVTIFGVWIGLKTLTFPEGLNNFIDNVYFFLVVINIAWMLTRVFDALVEEYLVPMVENSESDFDDQILPLARKVVKAAVWVVAVIVGLNNAGYDVGALLAGLGIGGLAFALAAQDTVSNLFGGFTIFTDQPFTVNDRIKVAGYDGVVKEIGIRSTRIQTLEGRIVIIPNRDFTGNPVENVSSEPSRKVVLNLGLTYDMDDKKVEEAMNCLEEIHGRHVGVLEENKLISFNAFGDFSLNILFIYYIKSGEDILGAQTAVNLDILRTFNSKGLEFAFPSQTIYTQSLDK